MATVAELIEQYQTDEAMQEEVADILQGGPDQMQAAVLLPED